ncbi:Aspartate aminotransferase [Klebsiella pneumoniae ISC21]|nr:Aspartate aminotransferase [Klebsiella pneumoniae ISC21]
MFENITAAPADPILGLADLFRADDRPEKINLGIGVYKDETGKKNARSDQRQKSRAVSAGK